MRRAADFPIGTPDHIIDAYIESMERRWGSDDDPLILAGPEGWSRLARQAMGPGAAVAAQRFNASSDLRAILPSVRVPTLVLHGLEAPVFRVEHGRYLATHIPTARLVELPGRTDLFSAEGQTALDEAQEFLTGSRVRLDADLVLATVLFTDIADSTARMAVAGDQGWRDVIDEHDKLVRGALARHRGQEVKTLGDGFLALFDGVVRAIECAAAIVSAAAKIDIDVRAGIHTGECVRRGDDVSGIAVNIASRIQACATGREVLVSQTVRDLVVGSPLRFEDRGPHPLKGVPGDWRLFAYQG
jgi:class 3 adenylate cyclase